ncbi:DNA polymerase III subunit alpha [Siminovitchia terrae]|uniref:DNA polymerase III subunit alpha n=1 Tax=Siminovitchia terrae TaxID=1914933 RepID=A0A429XAN9_SIMTE|nr:DNA polymerase III subunit alpha [Siminovitchia terrae]RST60470.1 DNA polymerase III subunit alpha [Siminovitchia terrae]
MNFVQLQIATAYSLLSSTVSISELVQEAKKKNYYALSITDHNVLYGVLSFYQTCKEAGIKPIIGMTADVAAEGQQAYPLVLLARNNTGYTNLLKISSAIQIQQDKTISWKWLRSYSKGLIAITPGIRGEIEQLLKEGDLEQARTATERYTSTFDEDSFYLSLQDHQTNTPSGFTRIIDDFAKGLGLKTVVTNDVRYLKKEDHFAYMCLEAIREGEKLDITDENVYKTGEYYFKGKEAMCELFSEYTEALENTFRIAEECNVFIETDRQLLPKYPVSERQTAKSMLLEQCEKGLEKRGIDSHEYRRRLKYELEIINQMGFNDYFLIVWDFMKYARENGILTGPGRGSAAGSLVSYALEITDVDPIKHGLLFERFLNPERITMPDIDIDFPDVRRDQVIEYVGEKYGKMNVAHIITFGTFAAKAALRDTARVFGLSPKEIDRLSKMLPSRLGLTLAGAIKESGELRDMIASSEQNRLMFETALKLEGLPRHTSIHAAGVVISEEPLVNIIPIKEGPDGVYVTQLPMEDLEKIGLLKMDFLGLRNLTLLEQVIKSIKIHTGKTISLKNIPFADEKTFQLLQKGDTTGIFQLESEGMRKVLRELGPTEFEDIVAVNALFRPGPMENIPAYIKRKHGKEKIEYPHPDLKPILDFTYGVIVYQEQIMQIAAALSGYSLGEADLLRRAVSKKKREVLDQQRKRFVSGAVEKGYDQNTANTTYDLIVRFANYGFNRSHAVAYSFISWQLAWLKAHYPKYFMAALLTSVIGNEDKIALYTAEAKQKGIEVLPPSINKSHFPFLAEKEGIRFSLRGIKGLGVAAMKEIVQAREGGPFKDLFDFCLRVSPRIINKKILESLVYAGSFDEFGKDRAVLLATLHVAVEHAELMRPSSGTSDLFVEEEMFQIKPMYVEAEPMQLADKLAFEKETTGIFLSSHPATAFEEGFISAGAVKLIHLEPGQKNKSAGIYLTGVKTIRTKKGDVMAFITMSDPSGEMEGVVFPDVYKRSSELVKQGEVVLVSGNVEERKGAIQFIVQRIVSVGELKHKVNKQSKTLYVKIPTDLQAPTILNKLHSIFEKYPGQTRIILYYEKENKMIRLGDKKRVDPTDTCFKEISELLGADCVKLK